MKDNIRFNFELMLQRRNTIDSLKYVSENTVEKLHQKENLDFLWWGCGFLCGHSVEGGGGGDGLGDWVLLLSEIKEVLGRNQFSSKLETVYVFICAYPRDLGS